MVFDLDLKDGTIFAAQCDPTTQEITNDVRLLHTVKIHSSRPVYLIMKVVGQIIASYVYFMTNDFPFAGNFCTSLCIIYVRVLQLKANKTTKQIGFLFRIFDLDAGSILILEIPCGHGGSGTFLNIQLCLNKCYSDVDDNLEPEPPLLLLLPVFRQPRELLPLPAVVGLTWWQKIRAVSETGSSNSLWARGVGALKKIREWSEIVAGPRWKTFIRRFNRNRSGGSRHVNFQYDPLSYAMNFDEGPGQNGQLDEEEEDGYSHATSPPGTPRDPWTSARTGPPSFNLRPTPLSCAKERIVLKSDGCLLARLRTQLNYC
ncbi:UNVERIFIED_CONTAM: hypothetical protein Scaly_1943800 [Sesamum calycinum]|uniref:Uncharacterized protein n=1 Tax=Sesamum calycinum TaxID=2727403 RepID=A0AAW2NFM6_9LAMI